MRLLVFVGVSAVACALVAACSSAGATGATVDSSSSMSTASSNDSNTESGSYPACPGAPYDPKTVRYPGCFTLAKTEACGDDGEGNDGCISLCAPGTVYVECANDPTDRDAGMYPSPDPSLGCSDLQMTPPGGPINGWRMCCKCVP